MYSDGVSMFFFMLIIIIIKVYSLKCKTFINEKRGQIFDYHNGSEIQFFLISALADSNDDDIFMLSGAKFHNLVAS